LTAISAALTRRVRLKSHLAELLFSLIPKNETANYIFILVFNLFIDPIGMQYIPTPYDL